MQITRTSLATGVTRTRELDVTEEQLNRWKAGEHIQDVFSHLTPEEREFLKTGITGEEWAQYVAQPEDWQ